MLPVIVLLSLGRWILRSVQAAAFISSHPLCAGLYSMRLVSPPTWQWPPALSLEVKGAYLPQ